MYSITLSSISKTCGLPDTSGWIVKAKTALLRKYQVQSYLGGQFQEYVLHTMGLDAFPQHLKEAKELGFEIVEVSDNVVPLPDGVRKNLVDQIRDLGMIPVVEVGDKKVNSSSWILSNWKN